MSRLKIILSVLLFTIAGIIILDCTRKKDSSSEISIRYPFNNALFPPEFPAPTFEWESKIKGPSSWEVSLTTRNKDFSIKGNTLETRWTPEKSEWDSIKYLSDYDKIYFNVKKSGNKTRPEQIYFKISRDTVGAPILYRQIPIPFAIAEKQLDSMNYMLIDIGSSNPPHVAMRGFPVCGNCHSFSADGSTIGLDLDAGRRDKGGYFISEIKDTIFFNLNTYMSWSKIEKKSTFGLFSKISPDGRYIATTIKDRVVSISPQLNSSESFIYSLLFFPVNGSLAIYDRQTQVLKELTGANLDEYVQSNAFWTPDGKNIIFSRAKALPRGSDTFKLTVDDKKILDQFENRTLPFKYDLYTIPFNNGDGGKAEPVKGAADNGKSNFFPAVSPNGKWLVYCQAENYMHLMPDSRLYIVPAKGGKAKMLKCNLFSLNSWHAWSPNSKWIVFASKSLNVFTDLFLTHIDEKGNASIPVLVDRARTYQRVSNYPEFVNRKPDSKFDMEYDYVELAHIRMALKDGNKEKAKELFYRLMDQKPFLFSEDYAALSGYLFRMGLPEESRKFAELSRNAIDSYVPEK